MLVSVVVGGSSDSNCARGESGGSSHGADGDDEGESVIYMGEARAIVRMFGSKQA